MWHFIVSVDAVPEDRDLIVAVVDGDGYHALEFPCRWKGGRWVDARKGSPLDISPTHWQYWLLAD